MQVDTHHRQCYTVVKGDGSMQSDMEQNTNPKQGNNKTPLVLAVFGSLIVAVLLGILAVLLIGKQPEKTQTATKATTQQLTVTVHEEAVYEVTTQKPTEPKTEAPTQAPTEAPAPVTAPPATNPPVTEAPQKVTPEVPYLVRVKPVTIIYNEPSYSSGIAMTLDDENVYTIVAEQYTDGKLWGKFKSGVGWVCLNDIWANGGSLE